MLLRLLIEPHRLITMDRVHLSDNLLLVIHQCYTFWRLEEAFDIFPCSQQVLSR